MGSHGQSPSHGCYAILRDTAAPVPEPAIAIIQRGPASWLTTVYTAGRVRGSAWGTTMDEAQQQTVAAHGDVVGEWQPLPRDLSPKELPRFARESLAEFSATYPRFLVDNGDLVVVNQRTGAPSLRGKPDGVTVAKVVSLPFTSDAIVLLQWNEGPVSPDGSGQRWSNLLRCRRDLSVRWYAELPPAEEASLLLPAPRTVEIFDAFVEVEVQSGRLLVRTYSGYMEELDPASGHIRVLTFVK